MSIKLKVQEFNAALKKRGWSDVEAAANMKVSTVQIWRVRLPDNDKRHNDPGEGFIAGAMAALEKKFEELFFLSPPLRQRNSEDLDEQAATRLA